MPSPSRRIAVTALSVCFLLLILVTGCSDDPILGPDDGSDDGGGGSYGVINRLAPSDSTVAPANPKQF